MAAIRSFSWTRVARYASRMMASERVPASGWENNELVKEEWEDEGWAGAGGLVVVVKERRCLAAGEEAISSRVRARMRSIIRFTTMEGDWVGSIVFARPRETGG